MTTRREVNWWWGKWLKTNQLLLQARTVYHDIRLRIYDDDKSEEMRA